MKQRPSGATTKRVVATDLDQANADAVDRLGVSPAVPSRR